MHLHCCYMNKILFAICRNNEVKTGVLPNVLLCFRFEGFINKPLITHKQTILTSNRRLFNLISIYSHWGKKEIETRERSCREYTSPNWADTYTQTWTALGSLTLAAVWGLYWEKVSDGASTLQVRLQIAILGAPTYNPRLKTDAIISFSAEVLGVFFNFYNAVCFTLWVVRFCWTLKLGEWDMGFPGPQGLKKFQDSFLSKMPLD